MRVCRAVLTLLPFALPGTATAQAKSAAQSELPIAWEATAPGVWSATIGTPDRANLLEAAGATPRLDALQRLPTVTFPLNPQEVHAAQRDGRIALRFPLSASEELYGLGLEFKSLV